MPSSLHMLNVYLSALSSIIRKYSFTMYYYVDLRHALFLAINIVKSQVGSSTWVWVPFNTIAHPTSTKTFILSLLLIACSVDTGHIIVGLGNKPYTQQQTLTLHDSQKKRKKKRKKKKPQHCIVRNLGIRSHVCCHKKFIHI